MPGENNNALSLCMLISAIFLKKIGSRTHSACHHKNTPDLKDSFVLKEFTKHTERISKTEA
jgi:hypothetical protein